MAALMVRWIIYDETTGQIVMMGESNPTYLQPAAQARPGQRVRVARADDDWERLRWYKVNLGDPDGPLLRDEDKITAREAMLPGSTRMRD